jgi:hypothetical protein
MRVNYIIPSDNDWSYEICDKIIGFYSDVNYDTLPLVAIVLAKTVWKELRFKTEPINYSIISIVNWDNDPVHFEVTYYIKQNDVNNILHNLY